MQSYVEQYGFYPFCSYINWAYTESVELKDSIESQTSLTDLYATCQQCMKSEQLSWGALEKDTIEMVSSNDVRRRVKDQALNWLSKLTTDDEQKLQLTQMMKGASLKTTAGSENPNYVLFWTNEDLLSLIAQSLSTDPIVSNLLPLSPSSTIILEFTADATNKLNVAAFINDQSVTLTDCGNNKSCGAQSFASSLDSRIEVTNTTDWCATPSKSGPSLKFI